MTTIFISYRRTDSASDAGRLYDRLVERYGRASVFKDVDSIPPGVNFADYLADALQTSDVALVVIGPRWLEAASGRGGWRRRRLDDPADFVRVEIETALRLGVTVIPVLVGAAHLPPMRRLPASLRPLLLQNGIPLRQDPDFNHDVERVIAAIDYWQAQPRRPALASPAAALSAAASAIEHPEPTAAAKSAAPASKPSTAVALAEQIGIAASSRQARRPRLRLAFALTAALLVIAVGAAILESGAASRLFSPRVALPPAQETNTALAQQFDTEGAQVAITETTQARLSLQRYQPTGGIGPCDTNPAELWTGVNQFGWQWEKSDGHGDVRCASDKKTAILTVDPVDQQSQIPYIVFSGFPYDRSGFPSQFTASMTITFSGYDTAGANQQFCMTIGTRLPYTSNASSSYPSALLGVCRDGSWYLTDASHQQAGSLSSPLHVVITVNGNRMSISVNNQQLMPLTTFDAGFEQITLAVLGNTSDSITVSDFVLQPIAA